MNDDLIVRLAIICTIATALWLSFVKLNSPGRPQIMKVHNMKFNILELIISNNHM